MPPVVAVLTAELIAVGVGAVTAGIVASVLVSLATTVILGALTQAIQKKPSAPSNTQLSDRSVMVRQPITPWQVVFGQVKVSGSITFMASYASKVPGTGATPNVNIPFPRTVGSQSTPAQGTFGWSDTGDHKNYTLYFNAADQTTPISVSAAGITASFNIPADPGPYTLNWAFPRASYAGSNPVFSVVASKPPLATGSNADPLTGTNNRLEMLITVAGHPIDSFVDFFFGNEVLTIDNGGNVVGNRFAGFVVVKYSTGQSASDLTLNAYGRQQSPDLWTAAHMQSGKAKIWVTFYWNANLFAGSLPNVSALLNGAMPFDPRSGISQWSSNSVLCLRYYLQLMKIVASDPNPYNIDDTVTIAGANICEESIALSDGSSEDRYTCNGAFSLDSNAQQIIPQILGSMAGKLIYAGGKWSILVGSYRTPTVIFDEDDLDGNPSTQVAISARESFNAVKGTYYNPAAFWETDDFPEYANATYAAQDGSVQYTDIQLPFTTSASMCQRLSKILLEQSRQEITTTWPCKLTALQCQVGDVVMLNRTRLGWVNKPFEVTTWQFSVRGSGSGDSLRLGIDMTLRETASGVYDWNSGEQTTVDLAPNTVLPNPFLVAIPGTPVISEQLYQTQDSASLKDKAIVTWVGSTDGFVTNYQLSYKLHASDTWIVRPTLNSTTDTIFDIAPGNYDFRVQAFNSFGKSSDYSNITNQDIVGTNAAPSDITGLTMQALGGLAILRWDVPVDPQILFGGQIIVRHTEVALASATWENAVSVTDAVAGTADHAVAPLKAGTYLVKARSATQVYSVNAIAVNTKNAQIIAFSNVTTITEDSAFSGTMTNTTVSGGFLQLSLSGGLVVPTGEYLFASGIDLGAIPATAVRLTTVISSEATNVTSLIDSLTSNIDTWPDFDGSLGGDSVDCIIYVRTTDGNPAGSPTWSPWQRLVVGDYLNRAYQFKAVLSSNNPAYNILIDHLGITAVTF